MSKMESDESHLKQRWADWAQQNIGSILESAGNAASTSTSNNNNSNSTTEINPTESEPLKQLTDSESEQDRGYLPTNQSSMTAWNGSAYSTTNAAGRTF